MAEAESPPLPSCFICGEKIVSGEGKPGNGKVDQERLNKLLKCLNDLLIVASGSRKGDSIFYQKKQTGRRGRYARFAVPKPEEITNCCVSCYGILNGIESTHRCILASQKQLKEYLGRVRNLVVDSETEEKQVPSWGPKCLEIRRRILGEGQECRKKKKKKTKVEVKKEPESEDCAEEDSKDYLEIKTDPNDDDQAILPVEDEFIGEENSRHSEDCEISDTDDSVPLAKKPKMEQDEQSEIETDGDADSDMGGDDNRQSDSESESSNEESDQDEQSAKDSTVVRRRPNRSGVGKYWCYPLIIAQPDLFLYRGSHYFLKTPTHLQCLAHECSFQTEFDYYPSFQLMKTHILDTHFGKSPLFCLLCEGNPFFPYKDELRSHNKVFHRDVFNSRARAICECCIKEVPHLNLREHMFLHKSQDEIAIALKFRKKTFQETPNLPESTDKTSPSTPENSASPLKLFHALVIAREDLYLYRWRTYIQKTPTHLKCLAYQCSFQTQFDYYSSFQLIKQHIESVHRTKYQLKKMPLPCRLCENSPLFTSHDLLVDHNRVCHHIHPSHKRTRAVCECCLKDLNSKCLRDHMYFHKNDAEKAAALASDKGPKTRLYIERYCKNAERKYKCDFPNCPLAFRTPKHLERHKHSHLPKELRTDQTLCPVCGVYLKANYLDCHLETVHYPERMTNCLTCPICSKKFHKRLKHSYQAHLRRHHGERPFLCEDCGASFTHQSTLAAHVRNTHGPPGHFPCEFCGKVCTTRKAWKCHREYVHGQERKIRRNAKIREEKERRKGEFGPEQRFPCAFCEMSFKNKYNLSLHVKRKHNNLKVR